MCLFMLYLLVIKPGPGKQHVYILLRKTKGWTRDCKIWSIFSLKSLKPASFGTSLVVSTILLPGNWPLFTLIIEFKKAVVLEPKHSTDLEYHNTCNIYRIHDLNIRDCRY